MSKAATVRVPASSANLGPGFDVLALALDLHLEVEARESPKTTIEWKGEGIGELPLNRRNLIVRAAQEPFAGWSRPLDGLTLGVHNQVPIGRGLGSSASAIVAAALHGGFCIAALEDGGVRVHRLGWPERWRAVVFVPDEVSPTNEARRLVPRRPTREDAVFNLGRVAEWVLACTKRDRSLLRSAMDDRLHQPGRARAYPYLDDTIAAAEQAGALGAALSGAGGSVIAIADRDLKRVGDAMLGAAGERRHPGRILILNAVARGPRL
ncbi:MAG: homoserine kinase [Chloroflexi bacterium]|nr:MAG: homoserine kinase [Chloroflexota bacterium]